MAAPRSAAELLADCDAAVLITTSTMRQAEDDPPKP
jgi:hypothetical protein